MAGWAPKDINIAWAQHSTSKHECMTQLVNSMGAYSASQRSRKKCTRRASHRLREKARRAASGAAGASSNLIPMRVFALASSALRATLAPRRPPRRMSARRAKAAASHPTPRKEGPPQGTGVEEKLVGFQCKNICKGSHR